MEQQNRLTLQSNFRTGDRPTQEDFENVFESFINIEDDKVSVDDDFNLNLGGAIVLGDSSSTTPTLSPKAGSIRWNGSEFEGYDGSSWGQLGTGDLDANDNLSLGGAITLGDSGSSPTTAPTTAGTIRWNGSRFEGYDGSSWGPLGGVELDSDQNASIGGALTLGDSSGTAPATAGTIRWNGSDFEGYNGTSWGPLGGSDQWAPSGGNLSFSTGNVIIGSTSPSAWGDVLDVQVGTTRRVRFGNAAIGNGASNATQGNAVFSHVSRRTHQDYALMQNEDGETYLNCRTDRRIYIGENNSTQHFFYRNMLFLGRDSLPTYNMTGVNLYVNGGATKVSGGDAWNQTSDIRTKDNVQAFKDGLSVIKKLKPIKFEFNGKAETLKGEESIGLSAQDLQKVFPHAVNPMKIDKEKSGLDTDELLTVNLSALRFVMINAIQELDRRLTKLEK